MTSTSLYEFPLYYDILFGWDRTLEAAFYHRLFTRAGIGLDEPVLEVACGTGQIARRLAALGRDVTGLDNRSAMLEFLTECATADGLVVKPLLADMTTFASAGRYGAAYNPMSSFRLLQSDADAEAHLRAIAGALRVGGVYALDMTFSQRLDDAEITTDEEWVMSRGAVTIRATDDAIHVNDAGRQLILGWAAETHQRNYTPESFVARVAAVPSLKIESWHPEVARVGADGVSTFDADDPQPHASGRAMVLLRRV